MGVLADMERKDLEHLIRAASGIVDDLEIVIVGSQSILGSVPEAPEILRISMEADIYPLNRPELADLIDGSIGEGSPFEQTFGYYAQGVGPETATLPSGWQSRLTRVQNDNTRGAIGYCIDVHDLALSKYVANRAKDRDFNREMIRHRIVDVDILVARIPSLPIAEPRKADIIAAIRWDKESVTPAGNTVNSDGDDKVPPTLRRYGPR